MSTKKRLLPFAVLGASLAVAMVLAFGAGKRSTPTAVADIGTTAAHVEIDADPTNGTGPCSPVDATRSVTVGSTFQVAICLEDSALTPVFGGLNTATLNMSYPTGLRAPNVAGAGAYLDTNPDWDQAATDTGGDGTWACNLSGPTSVPHGNSDNIAGVPVIPGTGIGPARIVCATSDAADNLVSTPVARLATVTMNALTVGTGYALDFADSSVQAGAVESVCGTDITCTGATIDVADVPPAADLALTKDCTPNPVLAGGQVDCAITVTNNGPSTVGNVFILDNLPNDKVYNDAASSTTACDLIDQPALGLPGALNIIACGTIGIGTNDAISLASGDSATEHVVYDVPLSAAGKPETDYALVIGTSAFGIPVSLFADPNLDPVAGILAASATCASQTDPQLCAGLVLVNAYGTSPSVYCGAGSVLGAVGNACNNAARVTVNVSPANVNVTKVANNAVGNTGDTVTWTVTATNTGLSSASAVALRDFITDGNESIVSATTSAASTCVVTGVTPGVTPNNDVTCTLTNPMPATGAGSVVTMTVTANIVGIAGTVCTNHASVTFADPVTHNAPDATMTCGLSTVTIDKSGVVSNGGAQDTWSVNVHVAPSPPAPASNVVIVDQVGGNQSILSATGPGCVVSGTPGVTANNTATCTIGTMLASNSVTITIVANTLAGGPTCYDQASVDFLGNGAPILSNVANAPCSGRVSLNKDADPNTPGIQNTANLWLCNTGPNCWPAGPNGNGHLVINEVLANASDPNGVGAFEFQLKYDHKIFDITITATSWLYSTGRIPNAPGGVGGCEMTIITENFIFFGCVSKNPAPPAIVNGPIGTAVVATIDISPKADLNTRLTPGQKNGVVRTIDDENCEAADIYGDPLSLGQVDALGREIPLPGIAPGGQITDCGDLTVTVRILEGDLNLDCQVNLTDDQQIAFRYGSTFGNLLYDPWYDLEPSLKDFDIDIKDLQKVFGRNGSTCAVPIPAQPAQAAGGGSGSPAPGPLP